MTDTEMKKLEIRLAHWIEHNEEHARSFLEGADQASQADKSSVRDHLTEAAQRMREASDALAKALEALRA